MQRPTFASREEYAQHMTNAAYWRPYVETICERHSLKTSNHIRSGLPGSNPVFILDERYVVKLYPPLFGGAESFLKEVELYNLFSSQSPQLPFPLLLASGKLFPEEHVWSWPYIVTSLIPGTSIGEIFNQVTYTDKLALAGYLGQLLFQLHSLPCEGLQHFKCSWDAFTTFLERQRNICIENHHRWNALPDSLIDQLDDYIPPVNTLIDQSSHPVLLHCDLNQDHVLGHMENGHWKTTGIIDFGDARIGDRMYELIALHIGLFNGDKTLLRSCLESYDINFMIRELFVRKAMSFTLLFEFDVLGPIFEESPSLTDADTLEELAKHLWDTELSEP